MDKTELKIILIEIENDVIGNNGYQTFDTWGCERRTELYHILFSEFIEKNINYFDGVHGSYIVHFERKRRGSGGMDEGTPDVIIVKKVFKLKEQEVEDGKEYCQCNHKNPRGKFIECESDDKTGLILKCKDCLKPKRSNPKGILNFKDNIDPDTLEQFRKDWKEMTEKMVNGAFGILSTPCLYFIKDEKSTSATICKNCGFEKHMHINQP